LTGEPICSAASLFTHGVDSQVLINCDWLVRPPAHHGQHGTPLHGRLPPLLARAPLLGRDSQLEDSEDGTYTPEVERLGWVERTPPTYILASGIDVLSISDWIERLSKAA